MLTKIILLQFLAHLLADFTFQSQKWSDTKAKFTFSKTHVYHILVVFVLSYVLSLDIGFWKASLAITVIHFITDIGKSALYLKTKLKPRGKTLFFIDQVLHIITFSVFSYLYVQHFNPQFIFCIETKTTAIITGFVLCSKPTNILIKNILIFFSIQTPLEYGAEDNTDDEEKSLPNAGKLIGITERFLTLALILIGQYGAVGLIIAAKSILRFRDVQKNEYILAGTLLSFGIATLTGICITLL